MEFGILEFECFLIFLMCIMDMILGTISHVFFKKDNVSGDAESSIGKKLVIMTTLVFVLLIVHANDFHTFTPVVKNVLDMANKTANGIVVIFLYYELTSILKHIQNMTGIDMSKVPGVQSEVDNSKKEDDKNGIQQK